MQCVVHLLLWLLLLAPAMAETPATWKDDLSPIPADHWNDARAAHLLERAGFGGTPEEVRRLAAMTPEQAVSLLVDYERIDDDALPAFHPSGIYPHGYKLVPLEQVVVTAIITGKAYGVKYEQDGPLKYQPGVDEFYTLLVSEYIEILRVGQWWADRMVRTDRPLEEKLTLFWHDHFATSQEKVFNYELLLGQNRTLRENASGNFRTLLTAVAQDPAMLIWLDNRRNIKGSPNENFAREVLELFTLGEGQGYTETDVRQLARAFTGWTSKPIRTVRDTGGFINDESKHDEGDKTVLGRTGDFDGTAAINIILDQPQAARFITAKLYRHFVREECPPAVNERLAKLLVESDWELKPVLRAMFLSRDFYSDASTGTRIKPPVEYLVSTYRKLGLDHVPGMPDYNETSRTLGQVLFFPPNVAGWPEGGSWINAATLLARGNFVHALLFPDTRNFIAPDKTIAEGFRKIPLALGQYCVEPHVWDPKVKRMRPVSVEAYKKHLALLESEGQQSTTTIDDGVEMRGGGDAKMGYGDRGEMAGGMADGIKGTMAGAPKGKGGARGGQSKMSQIANSEEFNLGVGVYRGFVEAFNRVKPVERDTAENDFVAMLRSDLGSDGDMSAGASVDAAVDVMCRRFLSIDLHPARRAAVRDFLRGELGADRFEWSDGKIPLALRRTAHLILSSPEYQLD